jgi:bifunctional NMN adenylyltransferase/nudix hydrolase
MQNKYRVGYIVGRFSGLHTGHRHFIRESRKRCDKLVIFVGSANAPRTIKNPWTYAERVQAIELFLSHEGITNVVFVPQNDYRYNNSQWITDITSYIEYTTSMHYEEEVEVLMFGHSKEDTGYLKWFPKYKYVEIESNITINGTTFRRNIFENTPSLVTQEVYDDWNYFVSERQKFASYPYPETLQFCTGDALVECAGHVLMVKRGGLPGRGTWAIAGGHKNNNETFEECVFRELTEETNLRVPEKVLRGSVVARRTFDDPNRGCGIPRITQVIHIKIEPNPDGSLPEFRPADDAMECEWVLISEALNNPKYAGFDDHTHIIMEMTGVMSLPAYKNSYYRV